MLYLEVRNRNFKLLREEEGSAERYFASKEEGIITGLWHIVYFIQEYI